MSQSLILSLIILVVLTGSLWFLIQAEGGAGQVPRLLQRMGITVPALPTLPPLAPGTPLPTTTPTVAASRLPAEFTSGTSRYSQGSCIEDVDCVVSGCSAEVCGSQEAITTCEYSDSFPNAQKYACGCVQGKCGWRNK